MTETINKPLSEIDVWKRLLEANVRLYPDGFYRLNGIFGHSTTFGYLKATKKEIQEIRNADGTIKEPLLIKLAYFMKSRRSRDRELIICDNNVLVVLGIMRIIEEANMSENEVPIQEVIKR